MQKLNKLRVAVIAADGFEETELTRPVQALRQAGAQVEILSLKKGKIRAFRHHDKGENVPVDRVLTDVSPGDYDALVLPGGALNADALRVEQKVIEFIREFDSKQKPIAAICHAPWELISAGIVKGRKLTSYHTIQDDLKNAGAHWSDEEVVVDGNLVTSRQPQDIPAFNTEMINLFSQQVGSGGSTGNKQVA